MSSNENNNKYAFISYSHKDSELVARLINAMSESGINTWYDDGIAAGSEWLDTLQKKISECTCFVAFVSKNYVDSPNCRGEIHLAARYDKEILTVLLDDAKLEYGLELLITPRQHLFLGNQENYTRFAYEFLKAEILVPCRKKQIDDLDELERIANKFSKYAPEDTDDDVKKAAFGVTSREKNLFIKSRSDGPHVISFVNSKATNVNNDIIEEGYFTTEIDSAHFSIVQFYCKLIHTEVESSTKEVSIKILDSRDRIVYENSIPVEFTPGDSHFSLNWNIKGEGGLDYPSGKYCALIWVEDSRVYDFEFEITNTLTPQIIRKNKIDSLKKSICYHTLFKTQLFQWIASLVFLASTRYTVIMLAAFVASISLLIKLYRDTRKLLGYRRITALFLVFIAEPWFGICIFIRRMMNASSYKKNIEELKRLENRI